MFVSVFREHSWCICVAVWDKAVNNCVNEGFYQLLCLFKSASFKYSGCVFARVSPQQIQELTHKHSDHFNGQHQVHLMEMERSWDFWGSLKLIPLSLVKVAHLTGRMRGGEIDRSRVGVKYMHSSRATWRCMYMCVCVCVKMCVTSKTPYRSHAPLKAGGESEEQ